MRRANVAAARDAANELATRLGVSASSSSCTSSSWPSSAPVFFLCFLHFFAFGVAGPSRRRAQQSRSESPNCRAGCRQPSEKSACSVRVVGRIELPSRNLARSSGPASGCPGSLPGRANGVPKLAPAGTVTDGAPAPSKATQSSLIGDRAVGEADGAAGVVDVQVDARR